MFVPICGRPRHPIAETSAARVEWAAAVMKRTSRRPTFLAGANAMRWLRLGILLLAGTLALVGC